jgi:hypothetical protein
MCKLTEHRRIDSIQRASFHLIIQRNTVNVIAQQRLELAFGFCVCVSSRTESRETFKLTTTSELHCVGLIFLIIAGELEDSVHFRRGFAFQEFCKIAVVVSVYEE